ncbi:GNAT family N-acetyltransferase [Peloplasma aerotolerans]|uniref:GNAT family N-acetyltransferase n=1 Tax=Peloplasma aerotolerans TaxID=3044389 RepID=A0AAW6U8R1_9MOLU|nr:GNAT family N-acetyltransferase [Mariniplasma sp. M4Ah]MDI6453310.1 GNAT family N-acetyltransferase [Mariniplasma sp. M4Ah]MDR4968598.1 GNAT family N-acetyltransferase [Acholeplasmataceae bacterium]
MNQQFKIRFAHEDDAELILNFIKSLAVYEKMENDVVATIESIKDSLFHKKQAEVIIGEENGQPVGFALFYHNYSTFLGKANLFLEDLFVYESYRNKGYGKQMLSYLAKIAVERNCDRLDWWCLDWNTPSIEFYEKMGAKQLNQWTVFRIQGKNLAKLSNLNP